MRICNRVDPGNGDLTSDNPMKERRREPKLAAFSLRRSPTDHKEAMIVRPPVSLVKFRRNPRVAAIYPQSA
jgi:hypothetical protein